MNGDKTNGKANGSPHENGSATDDDEGAQASDSPLADPDIDASGEPQTPMPANVADLAAACVRFVSSRYGVPLDFSPDTLSLVDQYVRDSRKELETRPETLDLVQGAIGAYFGEVVRLSLGGFWRAEGDPSAWRVLLSRVFLAFNPVGMAREALTVGEAEGWGAFLQLDEAERDAVENRLAALPEVDESEFYLPTTRFDVLQLATAALRSRMEASGLGDVRFGPEDYS